MKLDGFAGGDTKSQLLTARFLVSWMGGTAGCTAVRPHTGGLRHILPAAFPLSEVR